MVDERPKIRGLAREPSLNAEHLDDLGFGERAPQPHVGAPGARVFEE